MGNARLPLLRRAALALLLLMALGIRLHAVLFEKRDLTFDESISYLCSAANQGRFDAEFNSIQDKELTVGDVRALYATPKLDFQQVATDLAKLDVHPPLYFWALHVVHHFFGFHMIEGMLLNFLVGLLTMLLLFHIVSRTSGSLDLALLVIVLFSLSPAVAQLDLEARGYQFLGFFALASAWLSERIGSGRRVPRTYALFIVVNICGFLTHYYFGFILAAGVALQWRRHGFGRQWAIYMASLVVSLIGFLVAFPEFFDFLGVYHSPTDGMERSMLIKAWVLLYFGWVEFFANGPRVLYEIAFVVIVLASVNGLSRRVLRGRIAELLRGKGTLSYFLWTLIWCVTFTSVFYLVDLAPVQAVGEQYYSYIWPLFAWFFALALRAALPMHVRPWALGMLLLSMLVSLHFGVRNSKYMVELLPPEWYQRINDSDRLMTDEHHRSYLPRLAIHLRPDLPLHITQDLNASESDKAAKNICVLLHDDIPLDQPKVKELMTRPGSSFEVLRTDELTVVCITTP